jgi:type IV pilus assembly protein PilA
LGIGLKTATNNYTYPAPVTSADGVTAIATPANALKGYSAAVGLVKAGEANTTQSILCETVSATAPANVPTAPTVTGGVAPPEL